MAARIDRVGNERNKSEQKEIYCSTQQTRNRIDDDDKNETEPRS